jgi:hypothetical protein
MLSTGCPAATTTESDASSVEFHSRKRGDLKTGKPLNFKQEADEENVYCSLGVDGVVVEALVNLKIFLIF